MGERETRIYRSWRRALFQPSRRVLWRYWSFSSVASMIVVGLVFVLPGPEFALWGSLNWHWFFRVTLTFHHPLGLWWLIFIVFPVNGLLIESYIHLRTPRRARVRRLLLLARCSLSWLPLLGLSMVPAWRWLIEKHPDRVYRDGSESSADLGIGLALESSTFFRVVGQILRKVHSSLGFVFWLISLNMFVLNFAISDLNASAWMTPHRRLTLVVALHLLGFGCTAFCLVATPLRREWSRLKVSGLWLVCCLWLVPAPFCFLGVGVLGFVHRAWDGPTTVLGRAHKDSASSEVLRRRVASFWRKQPDWRRWKAPWGLEEPEEMLEADRRLASYFRGRTFLLILEGMFAVQVLMWLALHRRFGILLVISLLFFVLTSGILMTGAYLWIIGQRILRTFRLETVETQRPGAEYLVLTQAAFFAGIFIGLALSLERPALLAFALVMVGGTYLMNEFGGGSFGWGEWPTRELRVFWICPFFQMVAWAYLMTVEPWLADPTAELLKTVSRLLPLWLFLLGLNKLPTLCFPQSWRHPLVAIRSSESPPRKALLLASAFLPLGGLAIPVWFFLKERCGDGTAS